MPSGLHPSAPNLGSLTLLVGKCFFWLVGALFEIAIGVRLFGLLELMVPSTSEVRLLGRLHFVQCRLALVMIILAQGDAWQKHGADASVMIRFMQNPSCGRPAYRAVTPSKMLFSFFVEVLVFLMSFLV